MQPREPVDHTIVVRVWVESHDEEPRARLFVVGSDDARVEHGLDAIELALRSTIEHLIGRG